MASSNGTLRRACGVWIAGVVLLGFVTDKASAANARVPVLEPVVVEAQLSGLPASERAALARIVRASRRMDDLYIRQVWPGTSSLVKERQSARDRAAQAELDALRFFKGPWLPDGVPFLTGVPPARPIGDFYPSEATKPEIETWLKSLQGRDHARAIDSFTAIRRGREGQLETVPYSQYYGTELKAAAEELKAAARLTHEPTLQRYLRGRARALLDDDYYESDVAFVGLEGPIDVVLGPYEVDDDDWFGFKTAFEASVAIENRSATERIAGVTAHLQELEDHLPLASALRGRKLGATNPTMVLDVLYLGGDMAAAGNLAAGYGLPNDLRVQRAVGARTAIYANVLRIRYDTVFRPIADAVLSDSDRAALRFDDIMDEIMMVRLFDSLGPQLVTGTQQPIAEALRENWSVAEQIRSMLLSLWGHRYLIEHSYNDRRETRPLYAAFLVPALARVRAGLGGSPSQGSTYVLNHLLETGAIRANADGRLAIDAARCDAEVIRAADEFVSLMAKGDAVAVRALIDRYVVVSPAIKAMLDRIGPAPPLRRPVFRTADQLDPPR